MSKIEKVIMSPQKKFSEPPSSEITPFNVYMNRRNFIKAAGLASLGALLAACAPTGLAAPAVQGSPAGPTPTPSGLKDETGAPANSLQDISHYNNYYEFSQGKGDVAPLSENFKTSPWQVEVSGLVSNPKTYSIDELLAKFPPEQRIYRLRCVEAWSMVIPWEGFPLAKLLKEVEPTADAKYVKFTSSDIPSEMPGVGDGSFPWPYTEGLRLDEAMNDLTLLVTGLYGQPLPPQDGAPIRVVVPWKYGFKSAKSLVKIELVAEQPATFWNTISSFEYGFYSNVNPNVNHPRWSQAAERRIGEFARRSTLLFNGYSDQVAQLYTGMDLVKNF
jgi:methionine sulfoxide reductase catalytic subunit